MVFSLSLWYIVLYISELLVTSNVSWIHFQCFLCILAELRLDYGYLAKRKLLKIKKKIETHRAISRLRLSSHKLATAAGKCNNIEKQKQICNLCSGSATENEIHLLLNCPVYSDLRNYLGKIS